MRLIWHQRPALERKLVLAKAFADGLSRGDTFKLVEGFDGIDPEADACVLFGIGGQARDVRDAYRAAGVPIVYIDKGYTRRTGHWRVSVGGFQPHAYFRCNRPPDRWQKLGIELHPYEIRGECVIFDGASNKYILWYGLGSLESWGAAIVEKIAEHTDRTIVYRPRPTHNDPPQIQGAELSQKSLEADFARAHVVVSYGGNIGFDCAIAGVPHFAIEDSIARPLSETDWSRLNVPRIPTDADRRQWACDVAYCQWTINEMRSGAAWEQIRKWL